MKPGNLSKLTRCQIRRQTRDEDSIFSHIESFGVRFLFQKRKENNGNDCYRKIFASKRRLTALFLFIL